MIGMFRAFVFSSQFPLLRLCLCLSVQLPAPLQGQSSSLQQRGRGASGQCPHGERSRGRSGSAHRPCPRPGGRPPSQHRENCRTWMRPLERAEGAEASQGHVSGRGLCHHSAAWPKGWGTRRRQSPTRRCLLAQVNPFGEAGLLQSSVPLCAAPPQNGLVFSGLLT